MKLDYSSLNAPLTADDIAAYKSARSRSARASNLWVYALVPLFFGLILLPQLVIAITSFASGNTNSIYMVVGLIALVVLFVVAAVMYHRHNLRRRAKLYKFAKQNQLVYIEDSSYTSYKGMIFDEGHSRVIRQLLRFPDDTEIGNYEYVTGSGKNRSTHTYGYVKIPLTRNLPHMVLDGKANNFLGFSGMTDSFDRSQKLSLEGNFDKYFTLYAPKEYERDALYVFTPDVMQTLIDEGSRYDMEIVDNELYVYSGVRFDLNAATKLTSLLKIINTVGEEIRAQTKRYSDERVDGREANVVAADGKRLKSGVNIMVLVVVGIVIFNLAMPLVDSMDSSAASLLAGALGVLVWLAVSATILWRLIRFFRER